MKSHDTAFGLSRDNKRRIRLASAAVLIALPSPRASPQPHLTPSPFPHPHLLSPSCLRASSRVSPHLSPALASSHCSLDLCTNTASRDHARALANRTPKTYTRIPLPPAIFTSKFSLGTSGVYSRIIQAGQEKRKHQTRLKQKSVFSSASYRN